MKKISKLLFVVLLALAFSSCEKFLDLKPQSQGIAVDIESNDSVS